MAGLGTKGRIPGSENTPVHGAVDRALGAIGDVESNVRGGIGNIETGARDAVGGVESGIRGGIGSLESGARDLLGGIFGSGGESAATPANPAPSRPAVGAQSYGATSAPTASARPLVVSPGMKSGMAAMGASQPIQSGLGGGTMQSKATGAKAKKGKKRQNKKGK